MSEKFSIANSLLSLLKGKKSGFKKVLAVCFVLFTALGADAKECRWTGTVSSDWGIPGNWTSGQMPSNGDDVIIPSTQNNPQISAKSVELGMLRIETGAVLRFGKDLSVTGYEGPGTLVSTDNTNFTVNSAASVTIQEFGVVSGSVANIYNSSLPGVDVIINNYMTVADISLNTYGNVTVNSNINAENVYADGTLTVNGSIDASGNVTSELGSAIVFTGSGRSLTCGGNLRIFGSITAPETVILTGDAPFVYGNIDFNTLNASACTKVTFDGNISVSGDFKGAAGTNVFLGSADFSGADSFSAGGDIWFYNTSRYSTSTFNTIADSVFNGFYFWGNTEVVINGNCSAVNFQMNSKGGPFVNYSFTSLVSKGTGAGSVSVTGTGNGNGILTSRSSDTAGVTGTLIFACPVDASRSVIETHSGTTLIIDEGVSVQAGRLVHSASGYEIKTQINVNGELVVSDEIDIAASVGAAEFNVGSSGSVSAGTIKSTATTYKNNGSTVPFTNEGIVSVSQAFNLPRLNIVNNGTVLLNDGAYLSVLTVNNSRGDTSEGQIKVLKAFGDGSQTALLTSASTTESSYQNLISAEGLSLTLAGKWVTSDFEAATNMGGKTLTLNGSTVTALNLSLSGDSGNLLNLAGSAIGDGFILSSSLTGGNWLSIDNKILVKDDSGKTAAFTYKAENSVPAAGTLDTDYAAVIVNGWDIIDPSLLTYVWAGGSTTGTAASGTTVRTDWSNPLNWNLKLVPENNCTVIIPDGLTDYPAVPSKNGIVTEWRAGNLTLGSGAGTAKITLNDADLVLSGKAGNVTAPAAVTNKGTIVYTNAGRITDGAAAVNDVTQGTVEYAAGSTAYSGVISETGAEDYFNLKISGNTWEFPENIKVKDTLTVSGGTFKGIPEAGAVRITDAASASGDFGFVSDHISVNARISAENYVATVKPASNSIPVVCGEAEPGSLCLTNTELTNLAAKTVIFGDENNTAGLKVNASLNVTSGIHLITGGALTQSTAGAYTINSVGGELYLQAATGIGDINGSAPVTVGSVNDTVSAKITGSGDIYIKISNSATLGGAGSKINLTPNGNIQLETTGVMTIGGDISSSAGTLGLISGGAIVHTAGILNSSSTIRLEAAGAIGSAASPVIVKHTPDGGNLIARTSSLTEGVFICEQGTMKVSGADDISVNGGSGAVLLKAEQFDLAAGAVGAGTGAVTVNSVKDDGSIKINQALIDGINISKERDFTAGGPNHSGKIDVNGNVNVSVFKSTLLQTGKISSAAGDFTGSVSVVPSGSSLEFSGDIAFDRLTASSLGGKTLYFKKSTTFSVKSGLTLTGTSEASKLALRSDSEGSQWNIKCLCGERDVLIQYVDVEDSCNNSAYELEASMPSKDSGNNDNWSFPGQLYTWTGMSANTPNKWKDKANWSPASVPGKGGNITIPDVSSGSGQYPVLDKDISCGTGIVTVEGTALDSRAMLDLASYKFTAKSITNNGIIRMKGGNTVTVNNIDASSGNGGASIENGALSLVEYYGALGSSLPWGKTYRNLSFVYDDLTASGASVSLPDTYAVNAAGKTVIASGSGNDISLPALNTFAGGVVIGDETSGVTAGHVVLNASALTIESGAVCDSLHVKCNVTAGSVKTSAQVPGTTDAETQIYEGAVSLTGDAVFTGTAGHRIIFDGNVSQQPESGARIKTSGSDAEFNGSLTAAQILAEANVLFAGNVSSDAEISVAGDTSFTGSAAQTVTSQKNQTYSGNCIVDSKLTITASDSNDETDEIIEFNGINSGAGSITVNGTIGLLKSGNYVTDGNQSFNCPKGVRVVESAGGIWSAGSLIELKNGTELFLDFGSQALSLITDISAANIWFWSGNLTVEGGVTVSTVNAAVWGPVSGTPAYSADDPRYAGEDTRFAYYGADSLVYQCASGTGAVLSSGAGAKPVFNIAGNFYVNGTDLSGFKFILPDSDNSNPVFNADAYVTEKQWGIPYAVAFNSTITDVEVAALTAGGHAWITAGESDTDTGSPVATQGCIDGGNNSGVQFKVPHIDESYSVYDDVIYVHFDMVLENSNGEISTNLALASNGAVEKGGVWYSSGLYDFSGAYTDKECTNPVTQASGDIQAFYLRAKIKNDGSFETWNTDATAVLPSGDSLLITNVNDSTDRSGVHKNITTDLSMLEGLFTAASGHTMSRNYGTGKEDVSPALSYKETKDKTSPVLIAVYTGQELHEQFVQAVGAASQKEYDAHNFIEFRYSEAVNVGNLAYNGDDINIRAEDSFDTAASHGGHITNSGDNLTVCGFGSMKGSLEAHLRPDCSAGSPHALYRHFSTNVVSSSENQTHRVRISIAGFVDGTVTYTDSDYSGESGSFHKWAGYIDSAETPSGTVTRIANTNITDIDGNSLASADEQNHPLPVLSVNGYSDGDTVPAVSLYGNWDTTAPEIAPFSTTIESWNEWYSTGVSEISEIIGSTTGSFLDHVEIHLFDNGRTNPSQWPGQWWRTKLGWNGLTASPSLPDTAGGARPFTENSASTQGGIRRSSLDGANSSFTYKAVIDGSEFPEAAFAPAATAGIRQRVNGSIFRNSSDPDTTNDSLFISLPLNASENLAVRTTFIISYDPSDDYITDLAGNRLAATYKTRTEFNSIDFTPPAYTMTLSPVAENKVYVIFTKRLAYDDHTYLDELTPAQLELAMEDIKDSFIVCSAKTSSSQIGITKAEFVSFSKEYTALLLTLERSVTLSDVETLWLRNTGFNGGTATVVDVSGFTVADTKIRDDAGNYLAQNKAHALSDFAVNAVEVLYAFGHQKNNDGWDEQGIYGETGNPDSENYAVHDFTRNQGNYGRLVSGRDITLQVRTIAGKDSSGEYIVPDESFLLMPSFKASLSPAMVCDKINRLLKADWRLWLPTALSSLASEPNTNVFASPALPENADEGAGLLWNYVFPEEDYHFKGGDEIQFVFKVQKGGSDVLIDHDADNDPVIGSASPTDEVPLYAVSMPLNRINAGDFSFIDLWSFGIKDQKHQRGGVSIFNNVINVNRREQTVVEVKMNEDGNLNIYVMTADGSIVKRLSHGRTTAGTHYYKWNGTNNSGNGVARGIYFIRVSGPGIDETRKVLCVKDN